jgi:NOL1/NOP2/fmu family ribosome biogenesis protein
MLPGSANKAEKYLKERFGADASDLTLKKVNGDYWLTSSLQSDLEFETEGIRAVRVMDIGLKPTTYLLQLLDDNITRNIVELDRGELEILEEGGMVQREMGEKGYVALKFENRVIGCGLYKDELVSSRVPEGRMKEVVNSI